MFGKFRVASSKEWEDFQSQFPQAINVSVVKEAALLFENELRAQIEMAKLQAAKFGFSEEEIALATSLTTS